jgi:hypothetical protein
VSEGHSPDVSEADEEMGKPKTFWKGYDTAACEHSRDVHARTISSAINRLIFSDPAWCRGYLTYLYDCDEEIFGRADVRLVMHELNPGHWWHLDIVESRSLRHQAPFINRHAAVAWWG